jgi:hypothetical protein
MRVCAMDAIKVPDADQGRPEVCGNIVEFAKDLHAFVMVDCWQWRRLLSAISDY